MAVGSQRASLGHLREYPAAAAGKAASVRGVLACATLCGALLAPLSGWLLWHTPVHPRASQLDKPVWSNGNTSCTNGKWAFRGGQFVALRFLDVVPEGLPTVHAWYIENNWLPELVRGVTHYRGAPATRPTNRFWVNINLEADVAIAPIGDSAAYVQRTYRVNMCPPLIALEH
jgi:hypothetical protein